MDLTSCNGCSRYGWRAIRDHPGTLCRHRRSAHWVGLPALRPPLDPERGRAEVD